MQKLEIDGIAFDVVGARRVPSTSRSFGVRKTPWMIDRYKELAGEFSEANVIELGIDQGASTAMFAMLLRPRRMAAFDIAPGPIDALQALLEDRELAERITVHWGVDQSDTAALSALIDKDFGDSPLDLIVDDASHALAPTQASFELLFPRLRPGGLFVIEDWSHDHEKERGIEELLKEEGERSRQLKDRIAERLALPPDEPSPTLSRLVLQLVIAAAHSPEIVADVRVRAAWCEVRRGPGTLATSFRVADCLGRVGRSLTASPKTSSAG